MPLAQELAARMEQARGSGLFADAAYAVFDRERLLLSGSCGRASADTWFDLASVTKLFVSTAILELAEQGALGLEQPVTELLTPAREDPALQKRLSGIRVRQLLTHSSGLLPWYPFYTRQEPFYAVLAELLAQPPLPGMHYSDLNFMLLGRIAAEQYGAALPRALELAGLTGPDGPRFFPKGEHAQAALAAQGRIAVSSYGNGIEEQMCAERGLAFAGFRSQAAPICGEANDGNCWYAFGGVSGHAGLFAPVSALVGLGQRYLQSGGLLAQAMQDTGNGRGLGFEIDAKFPDGCGHTGFTGPSLWLSPHSGLGMAILANRLAFPGQKQAPDLTEFRRTTHELVLRRQGK